MCVDRVIEKEGFCMKEKFLRFMQGRYGVDQFSKALLIAGLVVVLLSSFFTGKGVGTLFYFLGWVLIIYCYFRVFSRNISKRYAENQKYLAKTYKFRTYIQQQKKPLPQHRFMNRHSSTPYQPLCGIVKRRS